MSKFQFILLVVFGAFILIAVMLFSFSKGSGTSSYTVSIWGDISSNDFNDLIYLAGLNTNKEININYTEIPEGDIDVELTEALAEGRAPDVVLMPIEDLWKNRNKLTLIPFETINEEDYKNTFMEAGELFLSPGGIYALPLTVDPMVLYWNRDHLTKASLPKPPQYWDEIYKYAEALSEKDGAGNLIKSAITLGESNNIPHSKEIMSLLMLQAGSPITEISRDELRAKISDKFDYTIVPGEAALDFYTQFANPSKPFYSWNRALSPAATTFSAGDVSMYLGFASELKELKAKNPNLNIGISAVPQSRVSGRSVTFGKIKGLAVVRTSNNKEASLSAIKLLVTKDLSEKLSTILSLPPVRRDLLTKRPADAIMSVFYTAALQTKNWIDPDSLESDVIFRDMINSVTSGNARIQESVARANRELDSIIK
ncbi:MAG: extracellular solute-binding protein [bacterium]|nr:extracellular solute-binding protein [bacterium]